jgi:hypothetical protein
MYFTHAQSLDESQEVRIFHTKEINVEQFFTNLNSEMNFFFLLKCFI